MSVFKKIKKFFKEEVLAGLEERNNSSYKALEERLSTVEQVLAEILASFGAQADATAEAPAEAAAEAPAKEGKKRGRRSKAEIEAARLLQEASNLVDEITETIQAAAAEEAPAAETTATGRKRRTKEEIEAEKAEKEARKAARAAKPKVQKVEITLEPTDLRHLPLLGQAYYKLLTGFGISDLAAIANISEGDIEQIDEQKRGFKTRFNNQGWREKAQELLANPPAPKTIEIIVDENGNDAE